LSRGGADVLGARVRLAEGALDLNGLQEGWHEIVGIVEDFPRDETANPQPRLYTAGVPEPTDPLTLALHLHEGDTEVWGARLRQLAADVDPALQVRNVTRMDALLEDQRHSSRLLAAVLVGMTLSVLLVSAAGIYAMMSFAVMQRRREIGIRLALGARAGRIVWTMFSRAALQLVTGATLGLIVALLLNHAADGVLLKTHALLATGCVVLLVIVAGLGAAVGPARQGLRIQPTEAMREL
jgi:putative ABC transport system permease protein